MWVNSQLFWVGVAFLGLMGLELLIFAIGIYYVLKFFKLKKFKQEASKKEIKLQITKSKQQKPVKIQMQNLREPSVVSSVYQGMVSPGNTPSAPPPPPAPTRDNQAFTSYNKSGSI